MAVKQLSVFAENRKGSLQKITEALAEAGIDLRSICVADTEDYGILRIITDNTEKAARVLKENGFTAAVKSVVGVAIPDVPGGLSKVLGILFDADINLEYMYSIINARRDQALMVLRVDDNDKAEKVLEENGIGLLTEEDL